MDMSPNDNLYKEFILELYRHPRNKKVLADFDVQGKGYNAGCGDQYEVYLKFDDSKIADIGHTGDGCAISQAALSLITDEVKGKTKEEVLKMTEADVLTMLGIDISYTRKKCALLGLQTIQQLCRSKV